MTQDKPATTTANTSRAEPNKGPLFYGKPVTEMGEFQKWHATTMWPQQHDDAVMRLREFRQLAAQKGLVFDMFKVDITDGKTHFTSRSDPSFKDIRAWCYRVKFSPIFPDDAVPMFGLYVLYEPQDVDQRTIGVVPIYSYADGDVVAEDL